VVSVPLFFPSQRLFDPQNQKFCRNRPEIGLFRELSMFLLER